MLADAEQINDHPMSGDAVVVALRALDATQADLPDPIPALAATSAARAIDRLARAADEAPVILADWADRPAEWRPFASWAEARRAWSDARTAWSVAFKAQRGQSTPFIRDEGVPSAIRDAFIFSSSIAEAVAKTPDLPAELIAASEAEEAARDFMEVVRQRAVQTPAHGRDILARVRLITGQIDDVFDPLEPTDAEEAKARPSDFPLALEFYALNDDLVRALPPSTPDRAAWDAAFARWQAAEAARDPAVAIDRAETEAVNRLAPEGLGGRDRFQDHSSRWMTGEDVDNDVLLTTTDKARLRPVVDAWWKLRGRLLDEKARSFDDDAWQALHDEADAASSALLEAVPPGLPELVIQQRIAAVRQSENADDSPGGFDDLGWVSFNDDSYWTDSPLTTLHRHTLRLAGIDHPILHMPPFAPRAWIKAYEETGQKVGQSRRGLILTMPTEGDDPTAAMRAELAETPWKAWAIHLSAHERREGGGDPFLDSHMGAGVNDRRGGDTKFYGTVGLAQLIEFSADPGGGSPLAHPCIIDNRGKA